MDHAVIGVNSFKIIVNDQELGYITVVHPKIKDAINSKVSIVVAELRIDILGNMVKRDISYKEISIIRDIL